MLNIGREKAFQRTLGGDVARGALGHMNMSVYRYITSKTVPEIGHHHLKILVMGHGCTNYSTRIIISYIIFNKCKWHNCFLKTPKEIS